jgi:ATP-dependent helicase/DNAse subunit B
VWSFFITDWYTYGMAFDKYSAVWVSHSSMGDFLRCPRLYYLHNVYKDPKTGNKIGIVNPALSLGVAVHEVLEGLAKFSSETRMERNLIEIYAQVWEKVKGKQGGFMHDEQEVEYFERGKKMIEQVIQNPGPLTRKRVLLPEGKMLPHFVLSEENNLILCGKVDWIEYIENDDSLHIIDFKTGKYGEKEGSLQLPIYLLLADALQKRIVSKASYWYLDRPEGFVDVPLVDLEVSRKEVMRAALEVKKARDTNTYICARSPQKCFDCEPYEAILSKDPTVEFVGKGEYKQDKYIYTPKD